jgi:hypothetical protein
MGDHQWKLIERGREGRREEVGARAGLSSWASPVAGALGRSRRSERQGVAACGWSRKTTEDARTRSLDKKKGQLEELFEWRLSSPCRTSTTRGRIRTGRVRGERARRVVPPPAFFLRSRGVHRRASSCGDGGHSKVASKLNTTSERGGYRDDPTHQPAYPNGA